MKALPFFLYPLMRDKTILSAIESEQGIESAAVLIAQAPVV
jgi:hypothetical protein